MNRRDAMISGAALMAMSTSAVAQTNHGNHNGVGIANPLFDAASNCVKAGLVCVDHCLQMSLTACARASDQMFATCGTLAKLASARSPYLPAMAKVALAVCQDCETECRKHADPACKACAEACQACAVECQKVAA